MKNKEKEVNWRIMAAVAGGLLFLYLTASAVLIYGFDSRNAIIRSTAHALGFPAATVDGKIITLGNLSDQLDSVRKFYENQNFSEAGFRVDFTTADGQKRLKIKEKNILNKLIENKVIEKEANKRNIELTPNAISQEVNRKLEEYGNKEDVENTLERLYGWTMADFEEKMVKPDLYMEKLYREMKKTDDSYAKAKEKISKAQEDLKKGSDFESVVARYSEGNSAKNRGDLGWYDTTEMLPEISPVVFNMEKSAVSEIIESPLGYHIIKLEDKKNEDGADKVKLKQIFVRTKTLGEWLCEQEQGYRIKIYLKNYQWNKKECQAEFENDDMKNFESNLYKNSADDISVMF